jgi:hypothetical protein
MKINNGVEDSFTKIEFAAKRFGETAGVLEKKLVVVKKAMTDLVVAGQANTRAFKDLDNQYKIITNRLENKAMAEAQAYAQTNMTNMSLPKMSKGLDQASVSLKKNNMQMTNLALVLQDLPYGFRGIQNNLPALVGGMAGMTGGVYLAASAVIAFFTAWDNGLIKFNNSTKVSTDFSKEAANAYANETVKLQSLYRVATDSNKSMKDRLEAAKELKKEYPGLLGVYSQEEIALGKAKTAYNELTTTIWQYSLAQAATKALEEIASKKLDLMIKKTKLLAKARTLEAIESTQGTLQGITVYAKYSSQLAEVRNEIRNNTEEQKNWAKAAADYIPIVDGNINSLSKLEGYKTKDAEANKLAQDQAEKLNEQLKLRIAYSEQVLQAEIKAKEAEIQLSKDDFTQKAKLQIELLDLQKKYDLLKLNHTKYTEKEKASIALQIEQEYANKRFEIYDKTDASIFKVIEDSYANRILLANGNLDKEKVIYQEELYWLKQMLNAKYVSQEDYEKKVAGLKNKMASIEKKQLDDNEKKAKESVDRQFKSEMDAVNLRLKAQLKGHNKEPLKKQEDYQQAIAAYVAIGLQAGLTAEQVDKLQGAINGVNSEAQGTAAAFTPMADILNNLATNTLVEFGTQLGNMLSGGEFSLNGFLTLLADAIIEIGKHLLIVSGLFAAVDALFKAPGMWPVAIGVGIAAIAAGTALKNSAAQKNPVSKFANGGIISGPTMGLMGEYPGAKTNPEIVAPLDKLKSMMGGGGGGEFVLRGNDLVLAMQRSNSSLKLRRG